jgi:hypothetical protein
MLKSVLLGTLVTAAVGASVSHIAGPTEAEAFTLAPLKADGSDFVEKDPPNPIREALGDLALAGP